ncbi:tubulin-specific chaperone e, putative [Ichthyophthirius multifiliis]|uniref:Tubulin-specific chaperone e, putative n=1 Tax=Ichthyophthirius multifiliis TaxID=5932 RepID=G0R6L2_ICHMU|nr:tubulin-specific chaperone e, putative [Ichthyophthirius multifiliis]EGR26902.1 tubulin-specific chaperone e, putative [Ichthyophthirius multifiliis]|eukprot:XP_004023786.1 tubulin-specific chaperone e, putative [Ichthyophthirius multifiliis]
MDTEKQSQQQQESLLTNCKQYIGRRIECQQQYATILYSGPLIHEGKPQNSDKQLWFGVQWDDETRGKHNGLVSNIQYFQTQDNKNSGSLLKYEKVNLGISILDGVLIKYFKKSIQQIFNNSENNNKTKQEKENDQKNNLNIENIIKKQIQVEFDQDAYFETFKKHKKMVEFYGFDKIWERLSKIAELKEISLQEVSISDLERENYLNTLLKNIETLSLEKNLLYDWNQIYQIGNELKNLKSLSISSNYLSEPQDLQKNEVQNIIYINNNSILDKSPIGIFNNLKTLIVIDCRLNWKLICKVLPAFQNLEELYLCKNDMRDFQNIRLGNNENENLKNLKFLNLENTEIEDLEGLKEKILYKLQNLQKIILNKNKIKLIGKLQYPIQNITHISLEQNLVENPIILTELSQFQNLQYLNVKHNPISEKYGSSYIRQRAVAENQNLQIINGCILKKYERKDYEIFYLRKTFDDFFKLFDQVYYKYDYEKFLEWSRKEHPNHEILLKKYGNPYEIQANEPQNITEDQGPKNIMISLKIMAAAGPQLGKPEKVKKFPENTSVLSIKNVLSKLYGIQSDEMIIYYKVNQHDPNEILDEEHKAIGFYGIKNNSVIIIDKK